MAVNQMGSVGESQPQSSVRRMPHDKEVFAKRILIRCLSLNRSISEILCTGTWARSFRVTADRAISQSIKLSYDYGRTTRLRTPKQGGTRHEQQLVQKRTKAYKELVRAVISLKRSGGTNRTNKTVPVVEAPKHVSQSRSPVSRGMCGWGPD